MQIGLLAIGLCWAALAEAIGDELRGFSPGGHTAGGPNPAMVQLAEASSASVPAASDRRTATSSARPAPISVPRPTGRLTSRDIGLVINTSDPYSVQVGEFYIKARKLEAQQVLRMPVPLKHTLTGVEFEILKSQIDAYFPESTQALALAWTRPYAVGCNGLTGALAMGYDPSICGNATRSCAPSALSPYFNARTARPFSDLKFRPSMMLAAKDVATAERLIERGVSSDHTLGLKGAPPVHAHFVSTSDRDRNARAPYFPPPGTIRGKGVQVDVDTRQELRNVDRVLMYLTGATTVDHLDSVGWVPGALADHLTSFGGWLDGGTGQMSALEWINAGATASYGTVSEPCAHPQKFPHPQVLLLNYLQGATAIEAYWKSVAWPLQGVFVGEPLAAPFARSPATVKAK